MPIFNDLRTFGCYDVWYYENPVTVDYPCNSSGSGNGHHMPGDTCSADPEDQPYSVTTSGQWVIIEECPEGSDDLVYGDCTGCVDGDDNNGSNGGSNGGKYGPSTLPFEPVDFFTFLYQDFVNNLDVDLQQFLSDNPDLGMQIQQYFEDSGFEGEETITNTIVVLMENSSFDFEEALLYSKLNSIILTNDSFTIDDTINPDEALTFESVEEFEEYKNTFSFDSDIDIIDNQNGTHTTTFKVNYYTCALNINVSQKLQDESTNQDYEVVNLSTILSGFTLGLSWNQSSYDYTIYNSIAYIDLYGYINYNLFIEGIGTIYTEYKHYEMRVDIETGEQLLIENGED